MAEKAKKPINVGSVSVKYVADKALPKAGMVIVRVGTETLELSDEQAQSVALCILQCAAMATTEIIIRDAFRVAGAPEESIASFIQTIGEHRPASMTRFISPPESYGRSLSDE